MEAGEEERILIIRPLQHDGWHMGQDLRLVVTGQETITEIQQLIKKIKGIPVCRHTLQLEGHSKPIEKEKLDWNLNRIGLYNGDTVVVKPTTDGSWYWHDTEWYEQKHLKDIEAACRAANGCHGKGRMSLSEVEQVAPLPPPLRRKYSLRGFIRLFPYRLALEQNEVSERFYVKINPECLVSPAGQD